MFKLSDFFLFFKQIITQCRICLWKLRIKLLPQVPQHNQAVLSQGGRRGADVRRHRGGELQGREAVAHQCPGPTRRRDLWFAQCVESWDNNLALRRRPRVLVHPWWSSQWETRPLSSRKQQGKESPSSSWETKWTWTKTGRCPSKMLSNWLTWVRLLFYLQMSFTPLLPDSLCCWCSFDTVCRKATSCSPRSAPTPAGMWPSPWLVWPGRAANWRASNPDGCVKNWRPDWLMWCPCRCVSFAQSVNGTGGPGERPDYHPQCAARQTESLLQVKYALPLLDTGVAKSESVLGLLP